LRGKRRHDKNERGCRVRDTAHDRSVFHDSHTLEVDGDFSYDTSDDTRRASDW
jgi:hypothetical protein